MDLSSTINLAKRQVRTPSYIKNHGYISSTYTIGQAAPTPKEEVPYFDMCINLRYSWSYRHHIALDVSRARNWEMSLGTARKRTWTWICKLQVAIIHYLVWECGTESHIWTIPLCVINDLWTSSDYFRFCNTSSWLILARLAKWTESI